MGLRALRLFVQSNSATYAPFGGLASAKMGPTPIVITNKYNNRLQPLLISASAGSSIISLCYDFHMVAVPNPNTDCSLPVGLGNNGNVFKIVNNRDNNRTQNFLYDPLNRISQAYTSGPNWGETFGPMATAPGVQPTSSGIDAWGNLTNRSGVTGKGTYEGLSAGATLKNQLTGYGYDAAGNMISNGSATYIYDADNRLITTAGTSYIYDGDGKRVKKCTAGTIAGTCATSAVGTLYWGVPGGGTLTETDLAGNTLQNYVFFNGTRIARRDASGTVHFYFSDHLGTHSLITDLQGDMPPQEESDYYPYGGEILVSGSDSNHYKFTGKERDSESGLDNFGARYLTSSLGRFMTPDWAARPTTVPYAVFGDPQSLNLYNYVRNDPLSRADGDGHCPPQASSQLQNSGSGCPKLTVTVTKDAEPHVMHGQKPNPDIAKVGTTTTIKVTDTKGSSVAGAAVKENPVTTNNITNTKDNNLANPETGHTSETGTISDVVAQNVVKEPTSTEEIQDHVNSTPYDKTTVQTLTITTQGANGQTCTCSATYSEHMTNVGANGELNEPNSFGVNYRLDIDPEVIPTTPQ